MIRDGIANKVAVVTGAHQGIGKSIADEMIAAGAFVIAVDRTKPSTASKSSDAVSFIQANLYDTSNIDKVVEEMFELFGRIDILVNCAGIYPSKPAIAITENEWDAVLDLNLKVPFMLNRTVAKEMIRQGMPGSIVNIASTAAQNARPGAAPYCASKAGLVMLTRVLALEWAPYQIRVNAVCPGLVETETLMNTLTTPTLIAEHKEKIAKTPMQRGAKPEEIAEVVLTLADSTRSGYITGQALYVDGGYTAGQTFATFKQQMENILSQ